MKITLPRDDDEPLTIGSYAPTVVLFEIYKAIFAIFGSVWIITMLAPTGLKIEFIGLVPTSGANYF